MSDKVSVNDLPNLAGIATSDLVESIGAGKFSAAYINWSRTMHLLRTHAPGWLPELVLTPDGGVLHAAPMHACGAFLMIRFRHMGTGNFTPAVPQAVMDPRNAAIPMDKISARDITDTHRRGCCLAAAMIFGLAYELWAKMPLESGYQEPVAEPAPATITPDQANELLDQAKATGTDVKKILEWAGVKEVLDFPASKFQQAMSRMKAKAAVNPNLPTTQAAINQVSGSP